MSDRTTTPWWAWLIMVGVFAMGALSFRVAPAPISADQHASILAP